MDWTRQATDGLLFTTQGDNMDPLTDLSDMMMLASIYEELNEGKDLRMVLAETVVKFTRSLARVLDRQGMQEPFIAMIPATFAAFQIQIGWLIHKIDGKDDEPVNEDDPLVQELMEKLMPVADMVNGLIARLETRN